MIEVNKITAIVENNGCEIKIYKTKNHITTISNMEIQVPSLSSLEINSVQYADYCKLIVQNLLENGGITHGGIKLMWQPKEKTEKLTRTTVSALVQGDLIHRLFEMGLEECEILKTIILNDGNFKNGSLSHADVIMSTLIEEKEFRIVTNVKSGQLTKPQLVRLKDEDIDVKFNVTNIRAKLK